MRRVRKLALGASLLALLVGACSTGGGSTKAPTAAAPSATAAATQSASAAATQAASAAATQAASSASAPASQAAPSSSAQASQAAPSAGTGGGPTIKIGSDGFYEAKIVAEIYAQALEAKGYTVDRTGIGMGARAVSAPALVSGQIDLKPEYVGSGLRTVSVYTGPSAATPAASAAASASASGSAAPPVDVTDPNAEQQALQDALSAVGITVLDISPAADQNGFVVRPDTAQANNLAKMSDTTAVQDKIKWGLATDCPTNPLCGAPGGALETAYGITQQTIAAATLLSACDQPMVDALTAKTIDLGELCTTQPDIAQNGWVLLEDDKHSQPADNLVPLVRNEYLGKVDKTAFEKILNDVSAKLTTQGLLDMNKEFTFDKKDIAVIAKAWLQQNGFVQ
jgi:osmoprotectant transport system substrate-binding protein